MLFYFHFKFPVGQGYKHRIITGISSQEMAAREP